MSTNDDIRITLTITLHDGTRNVTDGITLEAFAEMGGWLAGYPANPLNVLHRAGTDRFEPGDIASVQLRAELP